MPVAAPWDRDAFFVALKAVTLTATGLVFVKANQAAPAPALPYGTFNLTSGLTPSYGLGPETSTYDAGGGAGAENTLHAGGQGTLSVRFQAFATSSGADTDAMSYLDKLAGYLQTGDAAATLDPIALQRPSAPSDISSAVGATSQSRALLDVDFNGYLTIKTTTGYILTVEVTADTLDDVDGTVVDNSTQTIVGV